MVKIKMDEDRYSETITCEHSFVVIQGAGSKTYKGIGYHNVDNYRMYPPIVIAVDRPHGVDGTQ